MYEEKVREEAFQLYSQGLSFDAILTAMKGEYPSLSKKTLVQWSKRHGWEDRRAKIDEKTRDLADGKRAELRAKFAKQAEEVADSIIEDLQQKALTVKSKEGAVYAWKALSEFLMKLRGEDISRAAPDGVNLSTRQVQVIISKYNAVLLEHSVVGPILKKHQAEIARLFEDKLHDET